MIGLINVEKFKTAMMSMGEPLSENEMNEMMKDLPVDEDGYWFSFFVYLICFTFYSFIEYENFCLQFKPKDDSIILTKLTEEKKWFFYFNCLHNQHIDVLFITQIFFQYYIRTNK